MPKRDAAKVGALKCDSDSALRLKSFPEVAPSHMECDAIGKNPNLAQRSLRFR
jgi:hypothetical protein